MTDEGAKGQPVTEPPAVAPVPPPAATVEPAAEPDAPGPEAQPSPAPPEENVERLAAPVEEPPGPAPAPALEEARPAEANSPTAEVEAATEVPSEPEIVAPPTPPTAVVALLTPQRPRDWALLEFAGWRLLELAATVAAAAILTALVLPSETPADLGLLVERLQVTLPLLVLTLLVASVFGVPLGYLAARAGSWADVAVRGVATLGGSLSHVWLSMLLVLVFANLLGWLQPAGFVPWAQSPLGALTSLLLPALGLGLPLAAELALRFRDALLSAIEGPVVRTAEVIGLSRTAALHRHGLRAALAETCGGVVLPLALVVPAGLIVENVFYLPGLGRLVFAALDERDFATLQAGLVTLVALIGLTRLLALALQALADPRIARRA